MKAELPGGATSVAVFLDFFFLGFGDVEGELAVFAAFLMMAASEDAGQD